uniref:Natriuretic peptide C n=1 Tax=Pelusios castaneus TaxID=367368 RepID=A0A8C8S267_9SAUR
APAPHPYPRFLPLTLLAAGTRGLSTCPAPQVPAAGSERGEAAGGGGRARGSRLLRELRVDTRSRAAWARLLRDPPGPRRHKAGKKGLSLSKGCFGLKLDRIGSMSGLGC